MDESGLFEQQSKPEKNLSNNPDGIFHRAQEDKFRQNTDIFDQEFNRPLKHLENFNKTNLSRIDTIDLDDPVKNSAFEKLQKSRMVPDSK
jgi:hypothetical protein